MSRAEKGQRNTIEACERIAPADAAGAGNTGESHRPAKRASGNAVRRPPRPPFSAQRQAAGGGLLKYVVLYALTLVLQPVLAVVLTLAALWGLWKAFLWLIVL